LRIALLSGYFLATCILSIAAADLTEVRSLAESKLFDEALLMLEQLLEKKPDDVEARLLRGVILTRQGKLDDAIMAFDKLAAEFPDLPEPHNNLAVLYASTRRYDDARKALLVALALQPRYDTAYENLGDIYTKLAAISYDRAFQLNRTNERARAKSTQLANALVLETPLRDNLPEQPSNTTDAPSDPLNSDAGYVASATIKTDEPAVLCYSAGAISSKNIVVQVSTWFTSLAVASTTRSTFEAVRFGFRVFLPPLESKAAALVQIARLKTEGIADLARMPDNGISLGVYSTESAGNSRKAQIAVMGYKPDMEPRTREQPVWYVDTSASEELDAAEFTRQFPNTPLTNGPCPPS
jgi:hypothetical protein